MSDTVLSTHVLAITRHTGEIQSNYLTQSHLRQLESTLRKTVRFYNILNLTLAIATIASIFVLIYTPGVNDDLRKGLMIVLIVCYPMFAMYFPWMPVHLGVVRRVMASWDNENDGIVYRVHTPESNWAVFCTPGVYIEVDIVCRKQSA
ncbi:hypothetical protein HDU79_009065 [Rhizoclosmatium sp. JEL0117]|nr:hypothetical protein HDU79_009065 [Rhizoclosmatium sp. JEL0117]